VFCSYWVRKGVLDESPFWRVKLSLGRIDQLPRTLTEREMKALLTQASRGHSGSRSHLTTQFSSTPATRSSAALYRATRNLALLDIMFATGMRVGEVSALNVADFCVEEAMFRIKGKGGRARVGFAVDEKSFRIQKDYVESRLQIATENPALFLNSSGNRLSTQGITNVITKMRHQAGIERHVTPHMLRHTVATLLLRNGVDIRVVQEFLGHASIATTQRYTHITKEHLIEVLKTSHPSINLRLEHGSTGEPPGLR
jgi:integrase/recombinase XerD